MFLEVVFFLQTNKDKKLILSEIFRIKDETLDV